MKSARAVFVFACLAVGALFIFAHKAHAAPATEIICNERSCTPATIGSLFPSSAQLWAPGTEQSSTLSVTNSAATNILTLHGSLQQVKTSMRACAIEQYMELTVVRSDGKTMVNSTPIDKLDQEARFALGQIQPRTTHLYTFTLKMSEATPNECQGVSGTFDIRLRLEQGGALRGQLAAAGQVLGAQTTNETFSSSPRSVQSATSCDSCIWWPFYLLQMGAYLLFAGYARRGPGRLSVWWSPSIAVGANLLFLLFNSHCLQRWGGMWYAQSVSNPFCPLMAVWSLVMLLCFLILWHGLIKPIRQMPR